MTQRPPSVTAALVLVVLSALVWLTLGILIAVGAHPAVPDTTSVRSGLISGSLVAVWNIDRARDSAISNGFDMPITLASPS